MKTKIESIINKIYSKLIRRWFLYSIKGIRNTKPVDNFDVNSDLIVLSMVQKTDIDMLLIAIKSFTKYVSIKKFVIVADPSLGNDDFKILKQHLINVEFLLADDLAVDSIPRGGCWERILGIAAVNEQGYVIQLDADTITVAPPQEVIHAVREGIAFTLGTKTGQSFSSLAESASFASSLKNKGETHIQIMCEALLEELPESYKYYVRGCAGFAGFPKNTLSKEKLIEISSFFTTKLQERWSDWGSEQFASNLIIANTQKKEVLSVDSYDVPFTLSNNLVFHHYIGTVRFSNLNYWKNAREIIKSGLLS